MPPIEFFFTLGTLYAFLGFVFWAFISVLGLNMKGWPKWPFVALLALGFAVMCLGIWIAANDTWTDQLREQQVSKLQKGVEQVQQDIDVTRTEVGRLRADLTGENSYAYLHSNEGKKLNNGGFLMYLQGVGAVEKVRIGIHHIEDDGTERLIKWIGMDVLNQNVESGIAIGEGRWSIQFRAAHVNWNQILTLEEVDGVLKQIIEVQYQGDDRILCCDPKEFNIQEVPDVSRQTPNP